MGFEFNWLEVLAAAAIAYGALRIEIAVRRYQARKNWKPQPSHTVSKIREKGRTEGAVESIKCGNCGSKVKDFVEFTDGGKLCFTCAIDRGN